MQDVVNSLFLSFHTVILENNLGRAGADDLVPMFVLVLARSEAHNIKSILAFIDDFFDPRMRMGREFCHYVNLLTAFGFLENFKPGTFIVRCKLSDTTVPEALKPRISEELYNNSLKWLRDARENTDYGVVRAKGGAIGGVIAAAVATPIAILVGVATVGTGVPFSAGIIAGAVALGTGGGIIGPLPGHSLFEDIRKHVRAMNHSLEQYAIEMIDPFITNKMNPASTVKDIEDIAWLVRIRDEQHS